MPPARKFNYAAEVESFIETLFKGQEGFVYAPTKNPETGHWQTYFFTYPAQRVDLATHIMDASKDKEAYLSPSIFKEPDAKRPNWKGSNYVWTEFDGNAPKTLPKGIPEPTIRVQSSTKGHEHWYWRLDKFEDSAEVLQGLQKRLTYTLNGDKSSWDANQVLRPPGTLHHDSKTRVRLLSAQNTVHSITDFTNLIETPPEVVVNTNITALPDVQDVISAYKFNTDARDLFKKQTQPTGSRSSAMMRMAFHCVEMGMTNEEAYVILLNCDDRWGKYKNRTPESRAKVLTGIIAHARTEKGIQAEIRLNEYEPMYTIEELLALDFSKISWVFDQVMSENSLLVLASDPGVGKTTVAVQMGMAVTLGKSFLNWDYGLQEPMNAGFFSYEMDARQCGHFLETMLKGYSVAEQHVLKKKFRISPIGYSVPLNRPEEQQKILDFVDKYELKFLIIDSLKAITASLEEKHIDAVMHFINKDLRNDRGCTVLLIHHNRKAPQEGRSGEQSLADLYGDVFIQATAVHVIGLRSKSNGRIEVANTKNRLAPTVKTFKMKRIAHMQFEPIVVEEKESEKEMEVKPDGKSGGLGGRFKL